MLPWKMEGSTEGRENRDMPQSKEGDEDDEMRELHGN